MRNNKDRYFTPRRIRAAVFLAIFILLLALATYFLWKNFSAFADSPDAFRDKLLSYGVNSYIVAVAIQTLQVLVALIPGEVVEIGIGYTFGYVGGTLVCMLGVALGTIPVFLLTRRFGRRFVDIFVDSDKIDSLAFINSEKRLRRLIFLLFFIPGTPKDLFTYFVGLTSITLPDFLVISLIARIPSIVSSTVGGHFIAEGDYLTAGIILLITGIVSLCGIWIYNFISAKYRAKKK
jgi:uncharacterized membrane protein YdjX (TVP38/TMEM64 family)